MIAIEDNAAFLTQFEPPSGYRLGYCVGTTFSLEMTTLLQLAFTAGKGDDLKPLLSAENNADLPRALALLNDFSTRSLIYLQSCRMQMPKVLMNLRHSPRVKLFSLLDNCLVSVPNAMRKSSFHPKVWFMKFEGSKDRRRLLWRLVVTSKNLTDSSLWEVQCCVEGREGGNKGMIVKGLVPFLGHMKTSLGKKARSAKADIIKTAISDAGRVKFECPPGFKGMDLVWRKGAGPGIRVVDRGQYGKIIAISPFLREEPVSHLGEEDILITTKKDLDRANGKFLLNGKRLFVFTLPRHELHAKMYLCDRIRGGSDIWIGSANLTSAAMGKNARNTECMIKLTSTRNQVLDFEKRFIFSTYTKRNKIPYDYLKEPVPADFLKSDLEQAKEAALKVLEDVRDQISGGVFLLKRGPGGWMLRWQGPKFMMKTEIQVRGRFFGPDEGFDMRSLFEDKPVDPGMSEINPFLMIELSGSLGQQLEFSDVVEVVGRGRSALEDCVKELAQVSDLGSLLSAALGVQIFVSHGGPKSHGPETAAPGKGRPSQGRFHGYLEAMLMADYSDPSKIAAVDEIFRSSKKFPGGEQAAVLWQRVKKTVQGRRIA